MPDENNRGCFKTGCFGCLGVTLLGAGVLVVIALIGVTAGSRPAEFEETSARHELPPSAPVPEWPQGGIEGAGTVDLPLSGRPAYEFPSGGVGTLELDLSMGEFVIIPSGEITAIEVDAEYDTRRFRLEETFDEGVDGAWKYKVRFTGSRGLFGMFGANGGENHIEIRVPKGKPMRLVGSVKMGKSVIDLGGLALQEVDLDSGMGEHDLEFSEPTPVAMDSFRWQSSMGQSTLHDLGNASPARVDVSHRMGELRVDLDGAWSNDSEIDVSCGMGQCSVRVPDDVFIDAGTSVTMGERRVRLPDQDLVPAGAPTLHIDASGSMGEVSIN